jgi:hypothetical protein
MGSTVVGHMLVGETDLFHGGMWPSHSVLLYLGDFGPSRLELAEIPVGVEHQTWVPVSDNTMVDDAMLMLGLCVFRFPGLVALARSLEKEEPAAPPEADVTKEAKSRLSRPRPLPEGWVSVAKRYSNVERLWEACRQIEDQRKKVVLTALGRPSPPWRQLLEYRLNVEICCNVYYREYSQWAGGWTTRRSE